MKICSAKQNSGTVSRNMDIETFVSATTSYENHDLKKMCLISKSLYCKVMTSVLKQSALSRQRNVWYSEDRVSWYILI